MLARDDIYQLLVEEDAAQVADIFQLADHMREAHVGREVHLRSLIEISNHCKRHCLYCGIRVNNRNVKRYRMSDDEIFTIARAAAGRGRRTIVLQSGEDPELTPQRVARLVRRIKSSMDVAVTLSLGEYPDDAYEEMKDAGADRYLLKQETCDPALYRMMHPDSTLEARLDRLRALSGAGFQVGSGIIVGLPGQTVKSIAEDIMLLKKLKVGMAGIGPFIPHPATPLADSSPGSILLTLKAVAATRIFMPWIHIPATTAVATLELAALMHAMRCGANVIMPRATPHEYRALYSIYPGRVEISDTATDPDRNIIELVKAMGRTISSGYGHCSIAGVGC